MELSEGSSIDCYTVRTVLGEGGMAVVYRVVHDQLGSEHALKVLKLPTHAIQERLLLEGRVQATLRHPNVVAVTGIVDVEGAPGLVMELVDGPSLASFIQEGDLSLEQIDALAEGILAGVASAHAAGLVHRDLKPANILLAREGAAIVPKITDFGLAKLVQSEEGENATRTGISLGTPAYMSPEQIESSRSVDARSDVFALGTLLFELVSGERPFKGSSTLAVLNAVFQGRRSRVDEVVPGLPERMVQAIEGALQKERADRFADAGELLDVWRGAVRTTDSGVWDEDTLHRLSEAAAEEPELDPVSSSTPVMQEIDTLPLEEDRRQARSTLALVLTLGAVAAAVVGVAFVNADDTEAAAGVLGVEPRPAQIQVLPVGETVTATREVEEATTTPAALPERPWITVRSVPAGAIVRIDGLEVGVTPLPPLHVPRGRHRLALQRGPVELEEKFGLGRDEARAFLWRADGSLDERELPVEGE